MALRAQHHQFALVDFAMQNVLKVFKLVKLTLFIIAIHIDCEPVNSQQNFGVIRSAALQNYPHNMVEKFPNGSFHYYGTSVLISEWLADKLNLSIQYVLPDDEHAKKRGIEACLDLVANGEADLSASAFAVTPLRYPKMDIITFPTWEESWRFVVRKPEERARLFAFVRPFDEKIWLLLGISFVTVSSFMGFVTWANARYATPSSSFENNEKKKNEAFAFGAYFLYNVNVLTTHGDYLRVPNASFLIGVGCWLLGASILVYGYSSIVVSSLTVPEIIPRVNSLEEVVTHPEVSIVIRTDTYPGQLINTNTDVPLYKALKEKALKRPGSIGNAGTINTSQLVLSGKYVFPFTEISQRSFIADQYFKEKQCNYRLSKRLPLSNSYFYPFVNKANKQLGRTISIGSIYLWETGLTRYWARTLPYVPRADKCFATKAADAKKVKQSSIQLVDLTSAFFILAVGVAASLLTFVLELLLPLRFLFCARRCLAKSPLQVTAA